MCTHCGLDLQVGNDIVLRLEFIKERQMKVGIPQHHSVAEVSTCMLVKINLFPSFVQVALFSIWIIEALAFVGLIIGLVLKQTKVRCTTA